MNSWSVEIDRALNLPEPAACNRAITDCHYSLSKGLAKILGPEAGANFHSWAVWGSRKAGVTIRQEDLCQARDDAMRAGGATGFGVGVWVANLLSERDGRGIWYGLGSTIGPIAGAKAGEWIAKWSRAKASDLILEGNRLVLDDIGRVTAEFCHRFESAPKLETEAVVDFLSGIEQPLLKKAFERYSHAALAKGPREQQEATYFGNCLAILHEHRKLQPYIAKSMPMIVRRCVTKRLLTFEIGPRTLAVSRDVPSLGRFAFPENLRELQDPKLRDFLQVWDRVENSLKGSGVKDWTRLEARMGYIVDLFRRFHCDPTVTRPPEEPSKWVESPLRLATT